MSSNRCDEHQHLKSALLVGLEGVRTSRNSMIITAELSHWALGTWRRQGVRVQYFYPQRSFTLGMSMDLFTVAEIWDNENKDNDNTGNDDSVVHSPLQRPPFHVICVRFKTMSALPKQR